MRSNKGLKLFWFVLTAAVPLRYIGGIPWTAYGPSGWEEPRRETPFAATPPQESGAMSGVKMHRRGAGHAAALGAVALLAIVLSARTASAAVFTLDDVTLPGDPIQIVNGVDDAPPVTPNPPAAEGVANAIDNTVNKYLNFQ